MTIPNIVFNNILSTVFINEVYADVKFRDNKVHKVRIGINDETIYIKNISNNEIFFKTVRFIVGDDVNWFLLPINNKYLQKINWTSRIEYNGIDINLNSKAKNIHFTKLYNNYVKDPTFVNARRVLNFLIKYNRFALSSVYGFGGITIEIKKIYDENFNKKYSNINSVKNLIYDYQRKISVLNNRKTEIQTEITNIENKIKRLKEYI